MTTTDAETTTASALPDIPALVVPGPHTSVGERLTELARAVPDHPALVAADGRVTYAELADRAWALAAVLRETAAQLPDADAEHPCPIGVFAEQGVDSVVAMVAVMVAGHPCVVLDVQLPEARIALIAERAGIRVVLADAERHPLALDVPGVTAVLGVHQDPAAPGPVEPWPAPTLDTPASLIFTSGTTGQPKGVVYTHRTVLASGYTTGRSMRFTAADRVTLVLPQAFAAGQIIIFGALFNGSTLHVRDPRQHGMADLVRWLDEVQATTLHLTPSLLRAIKAALPSGAVLSSVRVVTTAGEKVYGRDVHDIRPHLGAHASFVNWLGSSETEAISAYEITATDPVPEGIIPAGRPVELREVSVRDDEGSEVPRGEVGVMHVISAYMSAGYWRDPAETARVFTALPDGRTLFRSGDRARFDEAGDLHVLGRTDDAVKIRGYLVAPEEVETALRRYPEIADAAVRAIPGADGELRLVAWVTPDPQHRTPSAASVRTALTRVLPAWMVPSDVVVLGRIPRNERGKVAAAELPAPPPRPEPVPPATDGEASIEAIWARILRLDHVSRDESFTALGGDSLAVEEMLTTVGTSCGVQVSTADLAEHPTLAEFAELVGEAQRGTAVRRTGPLVRLHPGGTRPPVFCFAGAGGHAAFFEPLATALGADQPVYAFQVNGFENPGVPDWTVGQAARRYVRMIEEIAPTGPVVLAGHSLGGLFALRVAQLLGAAGRQVPLVTLLDTVLPPAARVSEQEGSPLAALRRSRVRIAASVLLDFLTPTSVRRRRREPGVETDQAARPERAYLRTRLRILTAGLGTTTDLAARKDIFNLHGIGIAQVHRPRPWHGRTIVVLTDENQDDARWWGPLLRGEHEIVQVHCTHTAVLRWPYVTDIAARMSAVIDGLPGQQRD
ncbi:alpha/beta fold hydrolase [Modestobacter versicolor]|nr:alpha/beta fold hydrolase [Modestobacter versicolor]MBB3676995.1 amino acid adenylation domain-containing protein [Modestobacter versicolor]